MRIGHLMIMTAAVLALAGCGKQPASDASAPSTETASGPADAPAATAANDGGQAMTMAEPAGFTDAEKTKIQATFPAPYNTADLEDGEKQFAKCRSCHTITPDKMNMTGPHLYGLFGRKAATAEGYTYSDAMKAHKVTWDFDTLDTYLASPQTVVKGTKMPFAGIPNPKQRQDLIAYLKLETTEKK